MVHKLPRYLLDVNTDIKRINAKFIIQFAELSNHVIQRNAVHIAQFPQL